MRSITVSMYDIYIEDWLNVFPREQFLFLRSEDYFNDRISVIREILQFLDIGNYICNIYIIVHALDSNIYVSVNLTIYSRQYIYL